jgi:hypothetical protein
MGYEAPFVALLGIASDGDLFVIRALVHSGLVCKSSSLSEVLGPLGGLRRPQRNKFLRLNNH